MRITAPLIAAFALVGGVTGIAAQESGLAGLHEWRRVGSKTCFVDHYHDGSGSGPSQQAAVAQAVRSWTDFTVLEYGSAWGSYANSISKSVSCNRGASDFTCSISSIPCKGGAMQAAPKRRR